MTYPVDGADRVRRQVQEFGVAVTEALQSVKEQPLLMLDSASTQDRDDAFAVVCLPGGGWEVEVHVADVAAVVSVGDLTDREAFDRRQTVYRPGRTVRMLGTTAERAATLATNVDRPTLAVRFQLDPLGQMIDYELYRSRTGDRAVALSYEAADTCLKDPAHVLHTALSQARTAAGALLDQRRTTGSLAWYDLVNGWAGNEEGALVRLERPQDATGYMIVAELMIATNTAVSTWSAERGLPILYRNYRRNPVGPEVDYRELAAAVVDPGEYESMQRRLTATVGRAVYEPIVRGHHGLRLPMYTHATSPLRRWADLATQRTVLAALDRAAAPYTFDEISALATDLNSRDRAEQESNRSYFKAADRLSTLRAAATADLSGLDAERWHKALKLATAIADPPPAVAAELLRRDPTARDLNLLFSAPPGWAALRTQVYRKARADFPEQGASVLAMILHPQGTAVDYEDASSGPPHAPVFAARAAAGDDRGHWQQGRSKKEARQAACWSLLAVLIGDESPTDQQTSPDLPPSPPDPPKKTKPASALNPIARLNELAQQQQKTTAPPEWSIDSAGPANAPAFTCTVIYDATEATGHGQTKAIAKAAAAEALLENLAAKTHH